ncbi:retrovirus-related pol polyprotein from transposon TNT 1-94, partial [Tanacetum coccineum]
SGYQQKDRKPSQNDKTEHGMEKTRSACKKSKSVKKSSKRKVWKPTGKVFTNIGYIWRPTSRTFTIVGNACPLTRITTTTEVPFKKPTALENETLKPVVTLVYSRKPRKPKTNVLVTKSKVVQIVLCAINHLARHGLVRGFPKLKFKKDHLCFACAMGKSKKKPYKPKYEDTNQEKLYLLHMDLCGPMRVASVNGKKYILVIVNEYSRFTWVKCLRTDNGTEFVNQTLREYYEKVGISHETYVARSPQQNGVIKRRNRMLIEASCTMLIYAKAPLFLWAEAVATACYTQNRSIVRIRHEKTPYELLHDKPPDLSFLHVFGALCYLTNDSENLDFNELTTMASEHSSLGPALHEMTPATISSGLVPNPPPLTPFVPPSRIAPEPVASTGSPSSTIVDQDAPLPSNSQTTPETQSPIIPNDDGEYYHDIEVAHMGNDPYFGIPIPEIYSDQSSSLNSINTIVHPDH